MNHQLYKDNNQSPITKLQLITNTQYPNKNFQRFMFGSSVIKGNVDLQRWTFLEQTVVRRGSSVFCVSKSSEAERERLEPLERNERVCGETSDAEDNSDAKLLGIYYA
jgi:hypothetical protein